MTFLRENPNAGPEKKELPKETLEKTRRLCADYHETLDKTTYFDSKAIALAGKLLQPFKQIDQDNLPPSVKLVFRHRLAYLSFIASLGKSPAIGAFLDSAKMKALDTSSPQGFYESVRNDNEFKALNPLDLLLISSTLRIGIQALDLVNMAGGNWGTEANALLRPTGLPGIDRRVDDQSAAQYLQIGFRKMLQFVGYAKTQIHKR